MLEFIESISNVTIRMCPTQYMLEFIESISNSLLSDYYDFGFKKQVHIDLLLDSGLRHISDGVQLNISWDLLSPNPTLLFN